VRGKSYAAHKLRKTRPAIVAMWPAQAMYAEVFMFRLVRAGRLNEEQRDVPD
jgi:hypothetical protein